MPYPLYRAGQRMTAALANAGRPEYIQTNGSQTNATAVMADVLGLGFWALKNSIYRIELCVAYDGPATDIAFQWWPAGGTMARNLKAPAVSAATYADTNAMLRRVAAGTPITVGATAGTPTAFGLYEEDTILRTAGADGWVTFQYSAPGGGTATVQDGSFVIYTKFA